MSVARCVARFAAVCCLVGGVAWVPPSAANAATTGPSWAVVSAGGMLVRGHGAAKASHPSTGEYVVRFNTDMTHCAYEATAGDPGDGFVGSPIEVTVSSLLGGPHGVVVQTTDQSTGMLSDQPFHLTTYCGAAADDAVVGSDGTLARGSHVVSADEITTGQYEVVFDHVVNRCAFTATIGTIAEGLVEGPGEITVGGRTGNKSAVFVETTDSAGDDTPFPFHLAVNCGTKPLFGVVDFDGTKVRGAHVVSSAAISGDDPGTYEVIFDRSVSQCAYTATVGEPHNIGAIGEPVTIATATLGSNHHGVFLIVENANGTGQQEPFHLVVTC